MDIAAQGFKGTCYLGILALGYFSLHFMDPEERWDFIRSTVFGGVTFQRSVPLSYWDVYASGWPIFGLLAAGTGLIADDIRRGGHYMSSLSAADGDHPIHCLG